MDVIILARLVVQEMLQQIVYLVISRIIELQILLEVVNAKMATVMMVLMNYVYLATTLVKFVQLQAAQLAPNAKPQILGQFLVEILVLVIMDMLINYKYVFYAIIHAKLVVNNYLNCNVKLAIIFKS